MEQQNYIVTASLQRFLDEDHAVAAQLQLLILGDYNIKSAYRSLDEVSFDIAVQLKTLATSDFAVVPDSLQLASFVFAEEIIYANTKKFKDVNYAIKYKLVKFQNETKTLNTELAKRPWTIILAANHSLAQASDNKHAEELLDQNDFEHALERLNEQDKSNILDWHNYATGVMDAWLDKVAASKIDEWNRGFQNGVNAVLKFNNALQSYTGANQKPGTSIGAAAGTVIGNLASGISGAMRDISSTLRASSSELVQKLRGSGAALLKGSILAEDWLKLVAKNPELESISLAGMTYIKYKKAVGKNPGYGPTFIPFKITSSLSNLSDIVKQFTNTNLIKGSIFDKAHWLHYVETGAVYEAAPPDNMMFVESSNEDGVEKGPTFLPYKDEASKPSLVESKLSVPNPADFVYGDMIPPEADPAATDKDAPIEDKLDEVIKNPSSILCKMITSLDAQMQRFVAYFTTKDENGTENFLQMQTPDDLSEYLYYFYSNGFNCSPVKKATTELSYGAFKTTVALEAPNVNNVFSFSLPTDLQATFWKFVMEKGLGVNVEDNVYSNENPFEDKKIKAINLNFVMLQSTPDETIINVDTARVNKFVLENVYFSNLDALKFQQSFGSSPVKTSIKGIYRRLTWYHNAKLLQK